MEEECGNYNRCQDGGEVGFRLSGVRLQASGIRLQASGVRRQASGVRLRSFKSKINPIVKKYCIFAKLHPDNYIWKL